ncbi:MAG: hypothetical protein JXQ95_19130 [Alteromonas stellipolaris]|uniref:DUF6602 domain-containing protein n=1 Tax=Alteromonas stellipolaris TaxID=233316 RepID=UPI003B8D17E9
MIRDVSDLLNGLMQEERSKLDDYSLRHAPTIGKMYEGLASDILSRAIPESLGLQLVHGIIYNEGLMSGEIDCMLVKGVGEKIPFTDSFKWHIKDVVAVIEVKKSLYSNDLKDAFGHLRDVAHNFGSYVRSGQNDTLIDLRPVRRAFSMITGVAGPEHSEVESLCIEKQMIYHTLVMEHLSPIRIVLGYHGFKTESSFREALISFINENQMTEGFGIGSFPQLIVCGKHSLIKMNGYPYCGPLKLGFWGFYTSSNTNPVLLMLELIWTRLSYDVFVDDLWGDDLKVESFSPFLAGKIARAGDRLGWEYRYTPIEQKHLTNRSLETDWSPTVLSISQFNVFQILCSEQSVALKDIRLKKFVKQSGSEFDEFITSLIRTGLIAKSGDELCLTTDQCQCAILPNSDLVVAENNSGRLTRWIEKTFPRKN